MHLEIQYVEDCPNAAVLIEQVSTLAETSGELTLELTLVKSGESVPVGFAGSPTLLVDGENLFGGEPVSTAACALHPPTSDQVDTALRLS